MYLVYNNYNKYGVYIHIPFCRRRCPYCDFYFELSRPDAGFSDLILQEWYARKNFWPENPQTLYLGGGTPSLLQAESIARFIHNIAPEAVEITLEANPEDLSLDYLKKIRKAGVNRLSLGVQSLEASVLKFLGRKHKPEQAKQIILEAQQVGFERISVDIIMGISGEKLDYLSWFPDNQVGHLSLYSLTIEPNTFFSRRIQAGKMLIPDEDMQADAYIAMQELLSQLGYEQYEISSYSLPHQESRHNRIYWSQGIYLGLGPGAHSMRLDSDGSAIRRHTQATLAEWQKNPAQASFHEEILSPAQTLVESLAFGIRDLKTGILSEQVPAGLFPIFEQFMHSGWVLKRENKLFLSYLGARFADAIAREILNYSGEISLSHEPLWGGGS